MSGRSLGRLKRVELRDVWLSEASDFTPWLAQAGNITVLADTIGMELEIEAQEKNVGPFRADILCKDVDTDSWVLIENQLEKTDHNHLGQLLTYAAGLQAVTIVWVAAKFTEEHRATLDWLNEITDSRFRFLGLEVELWRIGESPPAPRFNVVSKPNDWTKSISRAARQLDEGTITETKAQQLRYWEGLKQVIEEGDSGLKPQTPQPRHWSVYGLGRSGFHLTAKVNSMENRIGAELFIKGENAKAYFALLRDQKDAIEKVVGETLSWEELPDRIGSRIALYLENVDPTNEADWPRQHAWLVDSLEKLDRALRQRVRNLDLAEAQDEGEAVA